MTTTAVEHPIRILVPGCGLTRPASRNVVIMTLMTVRVVHRFTLMLIEPSLLISVIAKVVSVTRRNEHMFELV